MLLVAVCMAAAAVSAHAAQASENVHRPIEKTYFGRVGDETVEIYTLTNIHGAEARVMTYGAAIVSLKTADRAGRFKNIVLGFNTLDPYLSGVPYFGATVGRYANRIANGRFSLDGETYQLPKNDGPNSLHGGSRGFDKRVWTAEPIETSRGQAVRFTYVSAAGEEGYPGKLTANVIYRLDDDNSLVIEYQAVTTAPTPINLANHAYFNLSGDTQRPILNHILMINADRFTPVNATLIPTGELQAVVNTPFDFREPQPIGTRISDEAEQLHLGHGYDHNWVLIKSRPNMLTLAAILTDPESGRSLEVRTTQPGLQFYSGNFLDGKPLASGTVFNYRTGLCLETQHFPDSPNQPAFPSTILDPGQVYSQKTVLAFRVVK
jgi:aldose 1-epimerase